MASVLRRHGDIGMVQKLGAAGWSPSSMAGKAGSSLAFPFLLRTPPAIALPPDSSEPWRSPPWARCAAWTPSATGVFLRSGWKGPSRELFSQSLAEYLAGHFAAAGLAAFGGGVGRVACRETSCHPCGPFTSTCTIRSGLGPAFPPPAPLAIPPPAPLWTWFRGRFRMMAMLFTCAMLP